MKEHKNEGLYRKYQVLRTDGKECADAQYFVLRVDKDDAHGKACRHAVRAYARNIAHTLPVLSTELIAWVDSFGFSKE